DERINDDSVGDSVKADGPGTVHQAGHGDEGVGGVEVSSKQEPGDDSAEATAGEAPLVEQVEVAATPARGEEAHHGDDGEEDDEATQLGPVKVGHCPPLFYDCMRQRAQMTLRKDCWGKEAGRKENGCVPLLAAT